METTRQLWLDFCSTSQNNETKHKHYMISFSSAICDTLLREADKQLCIISGTSETTTGSTPLIYDQDDVYFRFGRGGLPIFTCLSSSKKRIFTVSNLVTCLLHPRHDKRFFCRKVPTQISSNVAFIIDTSSLDNSEDIDSDDMGTWKNNKVDKSYVSVEITTNKVSSVAKTSGTSTKNGIFLVKRVYRIA